MNVDWFTFGAQIVNFLILVGLLKKVLYGPILQLVASREESFEKQKTALAEKAQENQSLENQLRAQLADLESQKSDALLRVQQEVEVERGRLLAEAREEFVKQQEHWNRTLAQQAESVSRELSQRIGSVTLGLVRQTLQDLAGESFETAVVETFLRQNPAPLEGPYVIITSFELPNDLKARLLARWPGAEFERTPEGVAGIEVRGSREKLTWSIDAHLESRRQELEQLVRRDLDVATV